jgi:hypothetical protein
VADSGNDTIRKITPAGVVTTIAGRAGSPGSADGTGQAARFDGPEGIACDAAGNLYVADFRNDTIRKITPSAVVTTLAGEARRFGSTDGRGAAARFSEPEDVTLGPGGDLFVADTYNDAIRVVTPSGLVSTLAGHAGVAASANGDGQVARFNQPAGIASNAAGELYLTDYGNDTIRTISRSP